LVDGANSFDATFYLIGNPELFFELFLNRCDEAVDVGGTFFCGFLEFLFDSFVGGGVAVEEDEVFYFGADVVEAEAVCDRDVEEFGFCEDFGLFFWAEAGEGTEVVEAVCEFDEGDADVVGHGEEDFSEGFGLGGVEGTFYARDFGEALHETGDGRAELRFYDLYFNAGVFYYIVEECGSDGMGVA
jgi:hypothetical protein